MALAQHVAQNAEQPRIEAGPSPRERFDATQRTEHRLAHRVVSSAIGGHASPRVREEAGVGPAIQLLPCVWLVSTSTRHEIAHIRLESFRHVTAPRRVQADAYTEEAYPVDGSNRVVTRARLRA